MKQTVKKSKRLKRYALIAFMLLICIFLVVFCSRRQDTPINTVINNQGTVPVSNQNNSTAVSQSPFEAAEEDFIGNFWRGMMEQANLPESLQDKLISRLTNSPDLVMELLTIFDGDPYLYVLVDKQHALDRSYVPQDLVQLRDGGSYRITRQDLSLREVAAASLESMAAASRAANVILTAASSYRSYNYQIDLYARNVAELGEWEASRVSARPGHSQHQLGLIVDFYPIDDTFAETAASAWLRQNASRYGWSISYPQGYEEITGYAYESWHYRYVGPELASFIDKYFDGIQQYALQFIQAWIEGDGA
jgi:D-alanyl-D-alanine carboxypeptidase